MSRATAFITLLARSDWREAQPCSRRTTTMATKSMLLRAAGARIRYYPVNRNLDVDLNVVAKLCADGPRVLYVTHYLGWPQPMAELQALCREKRIVLVEDCALAFMSDYDGKPLGTFGDYSVFCLYKSVPLPNGGVLVRNNCGRHGVRQIGT